MGAQNLFSSGNCLKSLNEIATTSDPLERIGKFLLGIFNIHLEWNPDKPFNPIHGEFFQAQAILKEGEEFMFINEQIWHSPPVNGVRLEG